MPNALETIARLESLVDSLDRLGADGRWLRERIETYLRDASQGRTLDDVLGLSLGQGGTPWWEQKVLQRRNEALRKLADVLVPELHLTDRAAEVLKSVQRYEMGRWRFDQDKPDMPEKYAGTKSEHLYRALATGEVPTSRRQVERILADDTKPGI